jgi:hypothetical protein
MAMEGSTFFNFSLILSSLSLDPSNFLSWDPASSSPRHRSSPEHKKMENTLHPLTSISSLMLGGIKLWYLGCREFALAGMAAVAVEGGPGDLAIVAFATKLPLDDLDHADLIGSGPHDEDVGVANLTLKPDTMKPVREDHGGHLGLFGLPVHDNISVLRLGSGTGETDGDSGSKDRD